MKRFRALASELTRRKVVRVVGIYLAVFAGFVATALTITQAFEIPAEWFKWPIIVGIGLIPIVAVLSWRYDLVPPQLVRDPKDAALQNPALSWATARHENSGAGYLLLAWKTSASPQTVEKRFFRPVSIGREANNDIELPDPRVSRHHAVLWAEDGIWRIRDFESANGTFIDNLRVTGTSVLPTSCELRFHPNGPIVIVTVAKSPETLVT
jgi:hypothetical protein